MVPHQVLGILVEKLPANLPGFGRHGGVDDTHLGFQAAAAAADFFGCHNLDVLPPCSRRFRPGRPRTRGASQNPPDGARCALFGVSDFVLGPFQDRGDDLGDPPEPLCRSFSRRSPAPSGPAAACNARSIVPRRRSATGPRWQRPPAMARLVASSRPAPRLHERPAGASASASVSAWAMISRAFSSAANKRKRAPFEHVQRFEFDCRQSSSRRASLCFAQRAQRPHRFAGRDELRPPLSRRAPPAYTSTSSLVLPLVRVRLCLRLRAGARDR